MPSEDLIKEDIMTEKLKYNTGQDIFYIEVWRKKLLTVSSDIRGIVEFGGKAQYILPDCSKFEEDIYPTKEVCEQAIEKIINRRDMRTELVEALKHAVEIAEAEQTGTWDDLLQYRELLNKATKEG